MSTAQIIYEQYKVLPKRIQRELKELIIKDKETEKSLSLMEEIEESLKQVKLIQEGKMTKKNMRDILND